MPAAIRGAAFDRYVATASLKQRPGIPSVSALLFGVLGVAGPQLLAVGSNDTAVYRLP